MKLSDLLADSVTLDPHIGAVEVGNVTADSRTVKSGDAFFAVSGSKLDGAEFSGQAFAAGAAAVVGERAPAQVPAGGRFIAVPNARRALALAAARLYPRQPGVIAAVTGTSGKTSVAAFTRQIWSALGHRAASIGTVGLVTADREVYGSLPTPDPVALHRTLFQRPRGGITQLALEASSHGLDQHRLDGVRIAAGGFTNLSREYLEYHPTIEAHLAPQLRLCAD